MLSRRPPQPYRADIDGLRALSVVPVCRILPALRGVLAAIDSG
jgi:hypothetical protein